MTWHREGTAPLTEGAQVPGEPRPRQLSGLARSPTSSGGQTGRGWRRSDAGLAGRGGNRVPREAGASGEPRAGQASWETRSGHGLGDPLTPGRTRARDSTWVASARAGARRPALLRPGEEQKEGRRPGPPPAPAAAASRRLEATPGSGETSLAGLAERREKGGRRGRGRVRGAGAGGEPQESCESRRSLRQLDTLPGAPGQPRAP